MKTLLRKELRAQRPFLLLIVFLTLLSVAEYVFGNFPDAHSFNRVLNEHGPDGEFAVICLILALVLGLALLPRERDEGTLEFLDALPCTRTRVFAAKALAGVLMLGLYPLLVTVVGVAGHALSRHSLDPGWHVRTIVEMLLIEWTLCTALLGVGLALSYLRRFAFFAVGVLVALYFVLDAAQWPHLRLFDFTMPIRYTFRAGELDIAWRQLGVTSLLGALGYLVAWLIFRMQGDRTARITGALERAHLRGPLVALGTLAMVAVWIGIGVKLATMQEEDEEAAGERPRLVRRDWPTAQLRAGGYVFLYPANLRERATALANEAGAIQEKVRGFLGAEAAGEIVADLDSTLRHVAATAEWKRVNMNITAVDELPEQRAVLGHETAHVYLDFLAAGRLHKVFSSARWWHEGLASYVEHRFFRPPEAVARIQRVAAAAHRRKASDFERLVDDAAWRAKHDPDLVYALGEVFCEALVAEHGDTAPGQVTRAFARADAPEGLTGLDLWRDAFQSCGWDLSRTIAAYYRRLQQLAEVEQRAFVEALPKLRGRVLVEEDWVKIVAVFEGALPEDAHLSCRVRLLPTDGDSDFLPVWEGEPREFELDRDAVGEGEFWYQLGIDHPDAQFTIYEDWQRARVK